MASRRRRVLATVAAAATAGCVAVDTDPGGSGSDGSAGDTGNVPTASPPPVAGSAYGYTHGRPTGNRVVGGAGALPDVEPTRVPVEGTPAWIAGVPAGEGSLWAIVADDGSVTGVRLRERETTRVSLGPERIDGPPLLVGGDPPRVAEPPAEDASELTHPVPAGEGVLYVSTEGDLVYRGAGGQERGRAAVGAPTDARIVRERGAGSVPGRDRAFVLADATDRYGHGVLGDRVEGGSVAVVAVEDGLPVERRFGPADPAVIEGLSPMLADVGGGNGGEDPAVVVTVSDSEAGARIVAYRPDGTRIAAGPAIGRGGWRHQLAVAPFAPDGRREIASVMKPHVSQRVQFYRREDDELRVVAATSGYSTHSIGSRNLDAALAGDLDGDGRPELLVPEADQGALAGIRRETDDAVEAWRLPLADRLSTNLAAVHVGGVLTVAAGTASGISFWPG